MEIAPAIDSIAERLSHAVQQAVAFPPRNWCPAGLQTDGKNGSTDHLEAI